MTSSSPASWGQTTFPEGPHQPPPPNKQRSQTGCRVCRIKKVKCDEDHPACRRCVRLGLDCDYTRPPRKKYTRRGVATAPLASSQSSVGPSTPTSTKTNTNDEDVESTISPSIIPVSGSHNDNEQPMEGSEGGSLPHTDTAYLGNPPPHHLASFLNLELSPDCVSILSTSDYSAIDLFRFVLPGSVDSRISAHSGPGMVWTLAQQSRMVLHMVCALGGQKWCELNDCSPTEADTRKMKAIQHYRDGLCMLAAVTQNPDQITNLPPILATLWLMISYELKFGDGCGMGCDVHLRGVASILLGRPSSHHSMLEQDPVLGNKNNTIRNLSHALKAETLCPISCQILLWIASADGGAVLNGFGGAFNSLLGDTAQGMSEDQVKARLECLRDLQQRSTLASYDLWGRSYPQMELVDDLQCGPLHCFDAESSQLKFMVGTLAAAEHHDNTIHETWRQAVASAISGVRRRYWELIYIANRLETPGYGTQRRFVVEIQLVVSCFHAIVLCFSRIVYGDKPLAPEQREAMKEIMSFGFKAYNTQGIAGLARLAWPLFVVSIESDDILHRSWILERFNQLKSHGANYRRAHQAILISVADCPLDERTMGYFELFRRKSVQRFLL